MTQQQPTTYSYGKDPLQQLDVYQPRNPKPRGQLSPVIIMDHGGGWRRGDKSMANVVTNKLEQWGDDHVMVFPNYRLDGVTPADQLNDLISCYNWVRPRLRAVGGDARVTTLWGHSAGAHLTTMMSIRVAGHKGSVILDSSAYNVPELMAHKHPQLYDDAFGNDPEFQEAMSPTLQLVDKLPPMFLVTRVQNEAGQLPEALYQTTEFARAARALGTDVTVYKSELSHGDINGKLGLPSPYTTAVNDWLGKVERGELV